MAIVGSMAANCSPNSDNLFGPRVNTNCRDFDFTLLFEDAFFAVLPAALFLVLGLLAVLFVLHLLFIVSRLRNPQLYTRLSVASGSLSSAAVLAAGVQSLLEDQRSLQPSDMLVIYFSASTLLSIPRLRSLWLIPSDHTTRALWTAIFVCIVLVVIVESLRKTKFTSERYRGVSKEQTVSFWSRGFYIWVLPFFQVGYSKTIQLADIPEIDNYLKEESAWKELEVCWQETEGRYRLLRAAFAANIWPFALAIIPRLAQSVFTLCQPLLIEVSVSYIGAGPEKANKSYSQGLVGAFVLVYLGNAVSKAIYLRQNNRMIARIRAGLTSKIYRHTTEFRMNDVKDSAALTLMGSDVERIVQALRLIHEVWASVPEMAVAVWLLARQISFACVVPLIVSLASIAATTVIATRFGPAQRAWNERVEKRVAVTAGMLSDMKAVKMLGLTGILKKVILELRDVELKTSETFRVLGIAQILTGNIPSSFAPFATFVVYAIIALVRKDQTLLSSQAFASLSLINLVTNPLLYFCQGLPSCAQAVACFGRIELYCLKNPISVQPSSTYSLRPDSSDGSTPLRELSSTQNLSSNLASFEQADISWSEEASEPVLRDLTLTIPQGLTAVIGPVASGKSTLLQSMIGETTLKRGTISTIQSGVAFCAQTPWMMDDTIRRNITGDSPFDQKWYEFSVSCCGLQGDLERMPRGDQTIAGSNGASLSGGQRQRVALARAVYSRLPVVILDDVMSGLDPKTASIVSTELFGKGGHFRRNGISVVVATHNRHILPLVDSIILLEGGRLVKYGSYAELEMEAVNPFEEAELDIESSAPLKDNHKDFEQQPDSRTSGTVDGSNTNLPDTMTLQRSTGNWTVYSYYARAAGKLSLVLLGLFTLLSSITSNYMTIWINVWTEANEQEPNQKLGYYLGIYSLLVVLSNLGAAGEVWSFFIRIINTTARNLHADLLEATLRAPFAFFQKADVGSITNRFNQDMDLIDVGLPGQAAQFTTALGSCLVQLIILCVLGRYFTATLPVLAVVLFLIQRYYLRTSRQVRLIDIEAKAPIYKHFIETIHGVSTVRSYHWRVAFQEQLRQLLDQSQRPFYMLLNIQQWLVLVLNLTVGALAVIIVALATSWTDNISAGAVGVALVLIIDFNSLLTQCIRAWTMMETSIGAVARIQQFVQETPVEPSGAALPPSNWPSRGAIQFQDITASYGPDMPATLTGLNLSIAPGEKVAVCGPSGSGKTSLIMAMIQMMELREGRIVIDEENISTLDISEVRSRLNIIPQDPFFIPGSIRFNLDPQHRWSNDAIEAALTKVGLWVRITTSGGLDMALVTSEWSQGERQLLCLARALLAPGQILILDEAMSSVDEQTEGIMQRVIEDEFQHQTIISVMHRFKFIDRYDRVVVLKHGRLIEADSPRALLGMESVFRGLFQAHNSEFSGSL
ncbi:ABC transporter [Xylariales sp. PMI_506]|nr:ABC transporter [Xylariales sp. PMI_506]